MLVDYTKNKFEQVYLNIINEANNFLANNFKLSDRNIEKMINYIDKGTEPERLANSIKTVDKAVSRYIIAELLNYKNYAYYLKKRAIRLGVSEEELNKALANAVIPEKYKELIKSKETGAGFLIKKILVLHIYQKNFVNGFMIIM